MAAVTPAMIKELRERTSAGMSDCKNALTEAEGDIEKAVEIILKKGIVKGAARAGKIAAEGEAAAHVSADRKKGVIVEVNCQTDFVARGDEFKGFVKNVVAVATNLAKGKDIGAEKYPGSDKTVEETRVELAGKTGENIVVRRWDVLEAQGDGVVQAYNHNGRVAVLVSVEAPAGKKDDADFKPFIENVAMQIAAMSPLVVDKSQVSAEQIAKQKEIYQAQMKEELDAATARLAELEAATDLKPEELAAEKKAAQAKKGPPEAMWPKVIEGKITKWYSEVTLLGQDNVWDPGAGSIDKVRGELGKKLGGDVKIHAFARFALGEGIEKKSEDLAAEVAKTIGA
ncbi:MAG: translation elongation factor Ts [Labilithrix sp.]|nr:translation elongation factor Ts [Labilithrix sp.]MCW5814065.1 translation elongation factor Ts [Labilithrix sp.]